MAQLAHLVGAPHLAMRGLLHRQLEDDSLDMRWVRLASRGFPRLALLQRHPAAGLARSGQPKHSRN